MVGELLSAGAGAANGLLNIGGAGLAARAQRRALNRAQTDLTSANQKAQGYEQPIYDTALKNYTDLSKGYAAGDFKTQPLGQYQFDPQSVFQDPEYQAQMKAGTDALNAGANAGSMLFSGANARDLTKYGQDVFAGRSDALWNRGFNARNTAFNQSLAANGQNFNQGVSLTGQLQPATSGLVNLATGFGDNMADLDLGRGAVRAGEITGKTNALTGTINGLANNGMKMLGVRQ